MGVRHFATRQFETLTIHNVRFYFNEIYVPDMPHVLINTKVEVVRNSSQKFQSCRVLITRNKILKVLSFSCIFFVLVGLSPARYVISVLLGCKTEILVSKCSPFISSGLLRSACIACTCVKSIGAFLKVPSANQTLDNCNISRFL